VRKVTVQPTNLPITLATAKEIARIEHDYDDAIINSMIKSACKTAESFTGIQLTTGTFIEALPSFATQINLLSPLQSVTSVKYYDSSNVQQTVASSNYRIYTFGKSHYIEFDENYSFPAVYNRSDAVQIEFVAGYATTPEDIASWIAIRVVTLYENREEFVSGYGTLSKIDEKYLNQFLYPYKIFK
jgi:uncharacterized phiE125 gp8 family phage protein